MLNCGFRHPSKLVASLAFLTLCSGCIDPTSYETAPVQVKTPQGVVTCQLFTPDQVIWDRAIDAPKGMSIKVADKICIDEGHRRKKAN